MPYDTAFYAPALWARVRDDYLAGESADVVCARHGVSRSQLFAQARAGGWRRSDQPSAGAAPEEVDDGAPAPPTVELAGEALRLGARAVARGRLHEAQGWIALAARLRALAKDERDPDAWGGVLEAEERPAARTPPPPEPEPEPVAGSTAATDLALAVGRLAREGVALCDRMEAGEDVDAEALALEAEVAALEAGVAEAARADAALSAGRGPWDRPPEPDGPAGLPPASAPYASRPAGPGWRSAGGG